MIKPYSIAWDLLLGHAEFSYDKAPRKASSLSLFKMVCEFNALSALDLVARPMDQKPSMDANKRVAEVRKLHEQVKGRIEQPNM